jgi:hypothetical protein
MILGRRVLLLMMMMMARMRMAMMMVMAGMRGLRGAPLPRSRCTSVV